MEFMTRFWSNSRCSVVFQRGLRCFPDCVPSSSVPPCGWIAEEVSGHDFLGILACPLPALDGCVTSSS